jgi:arsenate reductase (thioredoxin)
MARSRLTVLGVLAAVVSAGAARVNPEVVNERLQKYVAARIAEFDEIPPERRQQLQTLASYIRGRVELNKPARLTFICTHNSRRSHLCQIWAATAAAYYGVPGVETFSGGTEATAFNSRAVAALRRAGFAIDEPKSMRNPRYLVRAQADGHASECFSKVYSEAPNPKADFCAVMTCAQADKQCPIVHGASNRISLPYDDPKAFDGTAQETAKYDERCRQIARELLFVFSEVKSAAPLSTSQ